MASSASRRHSISGELLAVNQGTSYPVLLKLEHENAIASEWRPRRIIVGHASIELTSLGRKQLDDETGDWEPTMALIGRFVAVNAEGSA